MFIRPRTLQRQRQHVGLPLDLGDDVVGQAVGRQRAGAVARMDAGFLDMLEHAGDHDIVAVADRVDVDLDRRRADTGRSAPGESPETCTAVAIYSSSCAWPSTISIARPPST